jgi:hypothetical protein
LIELQIKSKIEETWGDLDHTLFYKDYSISPIKDTVQITMNNVGVLLDKIERLLFDLRESGDTYNSNAERLQIQIELERELTPLLKASCGVNYNVKEISFYLYYFKSNLGITDKALTELDFNYLNYECNNDIVKNYIKIRNKSFVLTILEGIYVNWNSLSGNNITAENIDQTLLDYITLVSRFISEGLQIDDVEFLTKINTFIHHDTGVEIFLDPSKHKFAIDIFNRVNEILSDQYDSPEDIDNLKTLYQIEFFDGNTKEYLDSIAETDFVVDDAILLIKDQVTGSTSKVDTALNTLSTSILEKLAN